MKTNNFNRVIYIAFDSKYNIIHLNNSAYYWLNEKHREEYDENKLLLSSVLSHKSYTKVMALVESPSETNNAHDYFDLGLDYKSFHNKEYVMFNSLVEIDYKLGQFSLFTCTDYNFIEIPNTPDTYISELSPREIEVFKLLKLGMKSKDIATNLNISTFTANTHRRNILNKLNLKSTIELIAKYK